MSLEISFSCVTLHLGFKFLVSRSQSLRFCFLANGFDQKHDKLVYLIRKRTMAVFQITRRNKSGF